MSTWQVFSDAGNNFRWQCTHRKLSSEPQKALIEKPSSPPHFPSISDLLFQGYSKLYEENQIDKIETPPTFRTGLGKPVVVKQSSLVKASNILGNQGVEDDAYTGFKKLEDNLKEASTAVTFQTGSGKPVAIKQSSFSKALSIFGGQDEDAFLDTGCLKVCEDSSEPPLTFQTGSGKLVATRKSSLEKAFSILGNLDDEDAFSDWAGKSVGEDNGSNCLNSMFQTGSGKAVNIHTTGLKKAKTLLGFEETYNENSRIPEEAKSVPISKLKFQTAGGRSVKVSGDALKRARGLLGDPDLGNFLNEENNLLKSKNFISPLKSSLSDYSDNNKKSAVRLQNTGLKSNLIKEFDAADDKKSFSGPLVDISNNLGFGENEQITGDKRKLSMRKYPSPFKKPRNSKFIPPLTKKSTLLPTGTVLKLPDCKRRVSSRYPFQYNRKYIKEYFKQPPFFQNMCKNVPQWLRNINSENADKHMFEDESGLKRIGLDFFFHMLAQSGCLNLSKEWSANHYRWIVWKLACYERCYFANFSGKFLTVLNVLEELKYRYEREVNNGQRSALKRILEGDAPPSSHLILCIASVNWKSDAETVTTIELTDGWYSVKGLLDELLLNQLLAGKLFVGQKIRICGASLCGWNAPASPLEASRTISLCLHINGMYRAHWADRLGFCKSGCAPLAFKCIKGSGGMVPSTLVGVTRIYPVLYRERLSEGGFVVRSERMESKRMQLHEHRRSTIVEGIMSEFHRGIKKFKIFDDEHDGEKISKLLEEAAEPEVIMAEMSSEQLNSFANYQAKVESTRQLEMQKSIEKALQEAGLSEREVNTLMRVRVVGLTSQTCSQSQPQQQGLITIWNPTEKQQSELVEGEAYVVTGLTPINSDTGIIYLRAKGCTTKWQSIIHQFHPFFTPRKPVSLLKMGQVPLSSEFDVAGVVIYVGEVHKSSHQKRQWVFIADGSISSSHPRDAELADALLAISFCSPSVDCDSIVPINYNLVGSTVGFCNVIKCAKDQKNSIWVGEATENSTYFLSYDSVNSKHLKNAANSANQWAKVSTLTIEKLRRKVLSIIATKI